MHWLPILLLGLLFGTYPPSLEAQTLRLSDYIEVGRDLDYRLVGYYQDTLLLFRRNRSKHYLQAFDSTLQSTWKRELKLEDAYATPLLFVAHKAHISLVYYYFAKGQTWVRVARFQPDATLVMDSVLARFQNRFTLKPDQILVSEDKQRLAVYMPTFEGHLELALADLETGQRRWQKYLRLGQDAHYRDLQDLCINNAGELFLFFDKNTSRRRKNEHYLLVYHFDTLGDYRSTEWPLPQQQFQRLAWTYDELNQQLIAAGLYSEYGNNQAAGVFYLRRSKTDSILHFSPFSESLMRNLTGHNKRKKIEGISNFEVRHIILRRDGGLILLTEQQVKHEYPISGAFNPSIAEVNSFQSDYLYENVLVTSLHPNGQVHWQEVLFKNQSSENDQGRFSSFFLFKTAGHLRLLYNDEIRFDANAYEYNIHALGEVQRNNLQILQNQGQLPEWRKAIQVAGRTLFCTAERGNKMRIFRLDW
jgi:hypothetical protein